MAYKVHDGYQNSTVRFSHKKFYTTLEAAVSEITREEQ